MPIMVINAMSIMVINAMSIETVDKPRCYHGGKVGASPHTSFLLLLAHKINKQQAKNNYFYNHNNNMASKKTSTKKTTTVTEKKTHFQVASIAPCTTNDAYSMDARSNGAKPFAFNKPKDAIAAFRTGLENISVFENWETPDATTLNIVLAPEWYFQKKQKKQKKPAAGKEGNGSSLDLAELGFWTRQEMQKICKGIREVSKDYPGWLLIPGTIL